MDQQSIFDLMYPKFKIDKPIRLIEMFSGYGSQALALKYLGVDFEHWKTCEWAVKSIQAYKDIHFTNDNEDYSKDLSLEEIKEYLFNKGISSNYNEPMKKEQVNRLNETQARTIYNNIQATHNLVNIQQVKGKDLEICNSDKYIYIYTYSFPCQDLSLAGKGKGMSDTSTRSGMLWEVERILSECKELGELPQVLLMENVPQVHSQDNVADFNKWKDRLEELGYKNYFQDLIATDYGIPQTRNRCFMISLLGNYCYSFPKPIPLKLKLKDMLEDNVDQKYFISEKMLNGMLHTNFNSYKLDYVLQNKENNCNTLTTATGQRCPYMVEDKYYLSDKMKDYITSKDDKYKVNENKLVINRKIACSKTTREGNTRADTSDYICRELPENTNILKIKNATSKGYLEAKEGDGVDISGRMEYHRGTVQKNKTQSLTTSGGGNNGVIIKNKNNLRIRKLTPRECFRLMGVKDEDYIKCAKNQSDSSLYHLAGDSIVVNVLMAIFKEIL